MKDNIFGMAWDEIKDKQQSINTSKKININKNGKDPTPNTKPAIKKESKEVCNTLKLLVAGEGFEPSTFGL